MANRKTSGFRFTPYKAPNQTPFERLFDIFKELITHTSGDFDEAIDWLRELDKEYELTTPEYTIEDFIEDLKSKGYVQEALEPNDPDNPGENGDESAKSVVSLTAKMERLIRQHALDQIFGTLKKAGSGNHKTPKIGMGDELSGDLRAFQFGDSMSSIDITESFKNAQINNGIGSFELREEDLVVKESHHAAQMSTVLMIDISHSMILYGEDRITPAKKVAMALAEMITTRYPKDSLEILVFGNDAWPIAVADLPYLKVGPFHTNTVAGLSLAMDMLRRKRNTNKQIFMITDGKPSCLKLKDGSYYKNSAGLDQHIVDQCYKMARQANKVNIPITTFMIAQDPYLMQFVQEFTAANKGKAFYTGLKGLGGMIFEDYENNRKKRIR
jgi:Ca-activated chloride channel family protein